MSTKKILFLTIFIILPIYLLLATDKAQASWTINEYGQLEYNYNGYVLGDDSEDEKDEPEDHEESDNSGSGSSDDDHEDSSNSGSGSSDDSSDDDRDDSAHDDSDDSDSREESRNSFSTQSTETEMEYTDPATGTRIKTETRNGESQTEIKFGEGEKIRTRTEEDGTRTDVYSGGTKVRFERSNGRFIIKAENEDGNETELGDDDIFSIRERIDRNSVRVATGEADSLVFSRGTTGAQTTFPISVDLETNELIVTTSAGERRVAVLPDTAVQNMLAANIIDRLGPSALAEAGLNSELESVESIFELSERDGVPVYEIDGVSDQNLLGFIPIEIERTVVVSAETGEVIDVDTPILDRIVDSFSF